ncbi:MAG: FKBP-type peptidyl-prolyl cis-trans isomerase [Bacteroidetes bacterium]|nr:FKBP-type peptidyl-prolyl cis-trans isomerase [Bacteroidota bacterium]
MNFKTILTMVAVSILLFSSCSSNNTPQEKETSAITFTNYYDSLSYSLGFDIGNNFLSRLKKDSMDVNMDIVFQGLKAGIIYNEDTTSPLLTKEVIDSVLMKMQAIMQEKQQKEFEERQNQYEERKKTAKQDGEKFLADNKNKPDVVVEKSGLQHRSIKAGTGATPKATDIVKFHIVAKYIDGEEFQSTRTMEAPAVPMEQLNMPGMKEAITKMKVGDIWEVVCPPKLAYGDQETGIVPPNSVVIFEIELIDIVPPKE